MEKNELKFNEIDGIESICAILGLCFPDSATEFQKSALTLAHLMASLRDFVLKGHEVPLHLITVVGSLSFIMELHQDEQIIKVPIPNVAM